MTEIVSGSIYSDCVPVLVHVHVHAPFPFPCPHGDLDLDPDLDHDCVHDPCHDRDLALDPAPVHDHDPYGFRCSHYDCDCDSGSTPGSVSDLGHDFPHPSHDCGFVRCAMIYCVFGVCSCDDDVSVTDFVTSKPFLSSNLLERRGDEMFPAKKKNNCTPLFYFFFYQEISFSSTFSLSSFLFFQ